ncbi:MAG: GntR family transcriptional regulator, partial [Chloroflexi bacterium]|nr:GntR family transcriptional regulator [Chloroflexota bacterium]
MTTIDHHSAIPIYHQLEMLIREQIRSGLWRPGDRIPTEKQLCQMYGISRSPVRQALKTLEDEGVLLRRRGAGTFVSDHNSHDSPIRSAATSIQTMILEVSHWAGVLQQVSQVWNDNPSHQQVDFQVQVVSHS